MAKTISARQFAAALQKAKNVGHVEESVTIDGMQITLRTLGPDLEVLATKDIPRNADSTEAEMANHFVKSHLARAIVELEGMDLRDVQFIEDVPDPTPKEPSRVSKLEKHAFLLRHVLSGWSKPAMLAAWDKLGEITEESEKKAREGVVFKPPAETPDEKIRRLLVDLRETSEQISEVHMDRLLAEHGLGRRLDEALRAMNEAAAALPEEAVVPDEPEPGEPGEPQGDDTTAEPAFEPAEPPPVVPPSRPRIDAAQALPLRGPARPPQPPTAAQVMPADFVPSAKSRAYAEEEMTAGVPDLAASLRAAQQQTTAALAEGDVLVIGEHRQKVDPAQNHGLLVEPGAPQTGGINPRFRPPPQRR